MIKALLRAGLPAAVCLALSPLAQATESGADSIGAGAEGFLAGALPPAGWYGVFYANHYHASQFNNEDGKSSVPGFGLTADVLVPRLLYMSDSRLWGGRVGGFALTSLPSLSLDAGGAHASRSGLGDSVVGPLLAWGDEGSWHQVLALDVYLPTGSYDKNAMLNLGKNYYSLRPVWAWSWLPASGWEASAKLTYTFNSKNRDTDYRSGQLFHADYALSYAVSPGWRVGVNGYFIKQTTDDVQNGAAVAGNGFRGQAFAIGPAVRAQWGGVGLEVRVLKEFAVRNRPEGSSVWAKLVTPF
ncbi:transporter [uncultured Aquitalea sp.]|uniref:SphA family protein n=1 Tax=uncultured Aquitalea sp. TaxID=540272 RepID=UPI0025E8C4BB|nr:transporter [uncultured Aquitalea sp.]